MKSAIAELWCSPATTIRNYLSDNATNINYGDENASIFNMMSMKYMVIYIYDGKCYTMNNNFSIKGTKIDSYCTHKRLQGRGETQGKKRRDLSGENYLGSTAQLIVASGNEIFCFQRTASLLIH